MDNGFGNASKKFADHCSFEIFWNTIKGLLDNMTSKSIHAKTQCIPTNSTGNPINLFRGTVFKAALYKEISKPVDHQRISLRNDCINDGMLLFHCPNLEFLLEENGCLLVIVANNLVHNILPIAVDASLEQSPVIQGLHGGDICLLLRILL